MKSFYKGIIAGALGTAALVVWQPGKAKDWGWTGQKFITALPQKIKSSFADQPRRKKAGLKEILRRKAIVFTAARQLGLPYVYGGDNPDKGFDCSGLVQYVLFKNGRQAPRTVADFSNYGSAVAAADIKEGDLLFFQIYSSSNPFGRGMNRLTRYLRWAPNHMGLYIGKGKMIHAPRTGKNVEKVSIKSDFWSKHLMQARDPLKK